jgi:hypothetical protein
MKARGIGGVDAVREGRAHAELALHERVDRRDLERAGEEVRAAGIAVANRAAGARGSR